VFGRLRCGLPAKATLFVFLQEFVGASGVPLLATPPEASIIESWRGDTLVAMDSVKLSALTPVFYCPCLPGITRIRLMSEHYWQMVLDDLVIGR